MKYLLVFITVSMFLGCSPSGSKKSLSLTELVMPASEHPELSRVEVVLAVNDINNPSASTPDFVVQMLKEVGVVGAVNFTYTWGDPNGVLLIDSNIHQFPTREAAKSNLMDQVAGGGVQVQGIADAAVNFNNQTISFVSNDLKVTLTSVSEEIDLESVAKSYSNWLSTKK